MTNFTLFPPDILGLLAEYVDDDVVPALLYCAFASTWTAKLRKRNISPERLKFYCVETGDVKMLKLLGYELINEPLIAHAIHHDRPEILECLFTGTNGVKLSFNNAWFSQYIAKAKSEQMLAWFYERSHQGPWLRREFVSFLCSECRILCNNGLYDICGYFYLRDKTLFDENESWILSDVGMVSWIHKHDPTRFTADRFPHALECCYFDFAQWLLTTFGEQCGAGAVEKLKQCREEEMLRFLAAQSAADESEDDDDDGY